MSNTYKTDLQNNNAQLQNILEQIQALSNSTESALKELYIYCITDGSALKFEFEDGSSWGDLSSDFYEVTNGGGYKGFVLTDAINGGFASYENGPIESLFTYDTTGMPETE